MKSLDELKAIREKMQSQIDLRSENEHASTRIVVGMATCGIAAGARTVLKALSDSIHEKKNRKCYCYSDRLYWLMPV